MALKDFTQNPPDHELAFEYDEIDEHIIIGTNLCCQVHFDEELLKKGVTADISLEEEQLDSPFGVDYFLWLPTKDGTPPSDSQIVVGVDTIDALVRENAKAYVHCKHGHGRSPTLVAAYYIYKGADIGEALDRIRSKRSVIHLRDSQIEALKRFQEKVREMSS